MAITIASVLFESSQNLEQAKEEYFGGNFKEALSLLLDLAPSLKSTELADCRMFEGMSRFSLGDERAARAAFESAVRNNTNLVPQEELFPELATEMFKQVRAELIGVLQVQTRPAGARLMIGSKSVGTTPYSGSVLAGEHLVRVEQDDYHSYERRIQVETDKPALVDVTMQLTPAALKRLSEESEGSSSNRKGSKIMTYGLIGGAAVGAAIAGLVATGSSRETGVPVSRTFENNLRPFQTAGPYVADVGANGSLDVHLTWDNPDAELFANIKHVGFTFETVVEKGPTGLNEIRMNIPVEAGSIYQVNFRNRSSKVTNYRLTIIFPG